MSDKKTKFEIKCEAVAEKTDVSFNFFGNGMGKNDVHEDDGNLHIIYRGGHYCFDVGKCQSLSGKEQNERTRSVLKELGMESKICDRTLVEETEDEDDCCPHCGHEL